MFRFLSFSRGGFLWPLHLVFVFLYVFAEVTKWNLFWNINELCNEPLLASLSLLCPISLVKTIDVGLLMTILKRTPFSDNLKSCQHITLMMVFHSKLAFYKNSKTFFFLQACWWFTDCVQMISYLIPASAWQAVSILHSCYK